MSGLRPLLRLEEKVAAEGRRLEHLGGPPLRGLAPAVLIAALGLHGAILLLPAKRLHRPPQDASSAPEFPRVWRAALPPVPPPAEAVARDARAAREAPKQARERPSVASASRAFATEPVPEPAPELALNTISGDVDAIIPNPYRPPPAPVVGPPSRVLATPLSDETPSPPPPAPSDAPPKMLEGMRPEYPAAARSLRLEGRVTLRLAVLPDGRVGGAVVEDCSRKGLGFEAAALAAVKQWRYEPAPLQTGARKVVVSIHFQQQEAKP